MKNFRLKTIYVAIFSTPFIGSVWAETVTIPHVDLDTLEVKVERKLGRKSTEVTGLGKVIKHSNDINKEQIMGIRDLTRYDPGIAVVEQGRGATSGYSIRGVDKNRVGLQVDGLVQAQSYITEHSRANGGSINEIEYENVQSIELSKGSASSEFGSGALGGAVSFRTKEPDDFLNEGKDWGVSTKTAYASKNKQLANTLSLAGRAGGFEALVQYTHRKGEETQVHKDATNVPQSLTRVGAYAERFELRQGSYTQPEVPYYPQYWFVLQDECQVDCTPKPKAKMTWDTRHNPRTDPAYTPAEQAQYDGILHATEMVSASDYTGADRIMPNPMDYESKSLFSKVGYRFNDEHYLGAVFENTKQFYDVQDKSRPSYVMPSEVSRSDNGQDLTQGMYFGDNPLGGISIKGLPNATALMYARGYYFDEHHDKNRHGLFYKYTPDNDWIDEFSVSYDRQRIDLNTLRRETNCSVYPHFDENCRADVKKPLSAYLSERVNYQEKHDVFQLNANKRFDIANTAHKIHLLAGVDNFKSKLTRDEYFAEQSRFDNPDNTSQVNDIFENVSGNVYKLRPMSIVRTDFCLNGFADQDCTDRNIKGYNHFVALKDHIAFGDKVDLGLGVRYDKHHFKSSDKFTSTGKYDNWSWNVGLTVKPTDNIALSYRRSNGFRVPAFYELYGRRGALDMTNEVSVARQYVSDLSPEKATNQEFGVGLSGNFGYIEVSHFDNQYKDLITTAKQKLTGGGTSDDGFYNTQDIKLSGINVLGKLDWYAISDKLPDGLYTTLAYNKIKRKNLQVKDGFTEIRTPILDALQPARYVAGIGFDHPSDTWGVNLMATYSKAKNADELQGVSTFGVDRGIVATKGATRRWYTYDLTGYYTLNDRFTVRGGVYNLLNRKYSTWESVRQSSINAVNQTQGTQSARYASSGRNFNLALEMKF